LPHVPHDSSEDKETCSIRGRRESCHSPRLLIQYALVVSSVVVDLAGHIMRLL
jgi:hypothetical protein